MRMRALVVVVAGVVWLGCVQAASAAVPATVVKNLTAVTELQYKLLNPGRTSWFDYPDCHRVCEDLYRKLAAPAPAAPTFDAWDQFYLLGVRDGLMSDFPSLRTPTAGIAMPAQSTDKQLLFGAVAATPPRRYAGMQLPGGTGNVLLKEPGEAVSSFSWGANGGGTVYLRAPGVGWDAATGYLSDCAGGASQPGPSPGPGFRLITLTPPAYCQHWDGRQWVPTPDQSAELWMWWQDGVFYGPSSLASWIAPNDPSPYELTVSDPGFSKARDAISATLANHESDYDRLLAWLDWALGGASSAPGSRQLDGYGNPAAPHVQHAYCGDPVNCATGNFTESYQDTTVRGPGITLSQTRSYNSQQAAAASTPGAFGYGWTASFRAWLEFPAGTNDVVVHHDNGSTVRFTANYDGDGYSADGYVQSKLSTLLNGNYRYVLPDQLVLEFDGQGRLLTETDHAGNQTAMSYTDGKLASVTDAVGRHLTYTYNGDGLVDSVTDPAGHIVHYGYTAGDLTSVTDVGGGVTQFGYDASHEITSITDPRNHVVTHNVYDSANRVISQTDALNHTTTWDYSAGHTTITDPSGSVTQESFTDLLPTQITTADGTPSQATTRFAYDDAYNLTAKTDANGHQWAYDYDLHGNLLKQTDPLGHATTFTYDDKHRVTSTKKPGGLLTSMIYDAQGNLSSVSQSPTPPNQSRQRTYQYNSRGQVTYATDAGYNGSRYWLYGYDAAGNRISARTPAGRTSTATFDGDGFPLTTTTPLNKTQTTARNAYELPTTVTDARGKTVHYDYDADGNLIAVTDRDGHVRSTVYDELNRPIEDHRPDGSVWTTTYTTSGQVASRIDGRGKAVSYSYDHQHRLHTKTDPLNRSTVLDYDPAGNPTSVTLPGGVTRSMTYDAADELKTVHYSDSTAHDVSYAYNVDGQRTSMTDETGTTSYAYDQVGRLKSQTSGAGQTTTYGYDDWDRVTSIGYPDALQPVTVGSGQAPQHVTTGSVTRTYDKDDNLTGVTDWLNHTTSFGYDSDSNLTTVTRPNGVNATYTYDQTNALASLTDDAPATTLTRSDERLLTGASSTATSASFGYDPSRRLTSGLARTYTYDDADNLTQTATPAGAPVAQQFDDANQLTASTAAGIPVAAFGYDGNGQRTTITPTTGPASAYGWTSAGTLASYTGPDLSGASSGSVTESYGYNGDGLRQTKTTDNQRSHEAWDISGSVPLMITDGPTSYLTGPGGVPVEQITADGTVRYFSHDQTGSTTALTDQAGATVQTYSYDAYGQLTSATPTVDNPFQYAGQYTDQKTGLQYLRARYYDPATSQFLSRDPLEDTTLQPYAYADNSPTNGTDPTGLSFWSSVGGAIGAVVPASVSDAAATVLDVLTGGAASSIACNGLTASNAIIGGANLALSVVPVGRLGAIGERLAAKVATEGDHIVLGLRAFDLEGTAAKVGGRTLLDDPAWTETLQKAVGDSSTNFTVSLDGLHGGSTYGQVMGAAQRGASGAGGATDWELSLLHQHGRLADTTFVRGGKVVENPFR